jgi:hypothetical protein
MVSYMVLGIRVFWVETLICFLGIKGFLHGTLYWFWRIKGFGLVPIILGLAPKDKHLIRHPLMSTL